MSKTDKDRPYRIKVMDETLDREVHHNHIPRYVMCVTGERVVESRYRLWGADVVRISHHTVKTGFKRAYPRECVIDQNKSWHDADCGYSLPFHEARWHESPPREFIHHVWTGRERVRERDGLNNLRREYNAHGELEDGDFENRQARHSAHWLYW